VNDRPDAASAHHADQVAALRAAVAALQRIAREEPRGPWRWAHPDLEPGAPPLVPPPGLRRHLLDDPLDKVAPLVVTPHPAPVTRSGPVPPEIADALATLLDQVARSLEEDGGAPDGIARAAVAVARLVPSPVTAATDLDP
jgi:hypothetical protein